MRAPAGSCWGAEVWFVPPEEFVIVMRARLWQEVLITATSGRKVKAAQHRTSSGTLTRPNLASFHPPD
jgi:hypothetical protein